MRDSIKGVQASIQTDLSSNASAELTVEEYYRKGDEMLKFGDYECAAKFYSWASAKLNMNRQNQTILSQSNDFPILKEGELYLSAGHYIAGEDISVGKCDLRAIKGSGNFCVYSKAVSSWTIGNKIGIGDESSPSRFNNLTLSRGDKLEINGNITVLLSTFVRFTYDSQDVLFPGFYRFGRDIPAGKYNIQVLFGEGDVILVDIPKGDFVFFQDMAVDKPGKACVYSNLVCTRNDELWINGNLQIRFMPSQNNDE